jgi:peptidoglycan hydrolase CwlO-like protein
MRIVRVGHLFVLLASLCGFLATGCSRTAPYCDTSLVTLDETRLDAETYEEEAAETAKTVADLEGKVSEKTKQIEELEGKPEQLEKRVEELKKGSGRE